MPASRKTIEKANSIKPHLCFSNISTYEAMIIKNTKGKPLELAPGEEHKLVMAIQSVPEGANNQETTT